MKKKFFYGNWVVLGAFLIMGGAIGIAWNINSVFVKPICEDTGYARSQITVLYSMLSACSMVLSLCMSQIYKRIKTASLMRIAAVVLPTAFFCISFCKELWQFYAVQLIVAISLFMCGSMPLSLILGRWYKKNYGTAVGAAFTGSGVWGMVFSSLAGQWIPAYGWRTSYRILGICIAVLVIPAAWFLIKDDPSEKGLLPYGAEEAEKKSGKKESLTGPMFSEIVKRPSFWILNAAMLAFMFACNAQIQCVSPRLTDIGYSIAQASNVAALGLGALAVGKLALGVMYDKMSVRITTALVVLLCALALTGELFASFAPMIILIVIGEGIACSMGSVGCPVMIRSIYGEKDYTSIYGKMMAIANVGGLTGPLVVNAMYDGMKSYNTALILCIGLSIAALICVWIVLKPDRKS